MPVDFDRLQAARDDAWRRWWELYCAPDVWTNTDAKHAMCLARLEYQDAVFEIAAAYDALPFLDTE